MAWHGMAWHDDDDDDDDDDDITEICRMRNRDLPLPAIRIFAEGVLQLLRQSPSSSSPPSDTPSSAGSGAEAAKWLCGQLDVEGFVGDEANQRLANDVWIDLATHSVTLRRLKGVLKAILRSYELIEAFYRTAGTRLVVGWFGLVVLGIGWGVADHASATPFLPSRPSCFFSTEHLHYVA
jgi:hypothetical protein